MSQEDRVHLEKYGGDFPYFIKTGKKIKLKTREGEIQRGSEVPKEARKIEIKWLKWLRIKTLIENLVPCSNWEEGLDNSHGFRGCGICYHRPSCSIRVKVEELRKEVEG